ncbi:MAG: RagB/SusD family nutrient uptake outer membrane protein [Bacteroidales bacterium]
MNKISKILLCGILAISATACNDDYLEKTPPGKVSLLTNSDFQAFSVEFYDMFMDSRIATSLNKETAQGSAYQGDWKAGYFYNSAKQNAYIRDRETPVSAKGTVWDFSYIRSVNFMFSQFEKSQLSESQKNHWKAVGDFFHSYWYMEMINQYGDVPYIETLLDETSAPVVREPREEVAKKVLRKLIAAEENLDTDALSSTIVTKNVIRAAISRFTLREATWQKYHNGNVATEYLDACIKYSKMLIDQYPVLYTGTEKAPAAGYGELWISESLKDKPGVIMYQEFVDGLKGHACSRWEHTSSMTFMMHQDIVDMYLCKDGKTISNHPEHQNDTTMYQVFENRDPRLYHVVMPPYSVTPKSPTKDDPRTWEYTDSPQDRKFIDLMGANESCVQTGGVGMKRIPAQNWGASLVKRTPNILGTPWATGFVRSNSGYYVWKNYSNWEFNDPNANTNTSDKPVFKIEEILLNYAEAMYEKNGTIDQGIADLTINKLRERAGIAPMNISEALNASFDPKRGVDDNGNQIEPLLWEIRRERIIELMGEGFGFDDVRRWKMCKWFVMRQPKGMWGSHNQFGTGVAFVNPTTGVKDPSLKEGYIFLADYNGLEWLNKYYLSGVPVNEINLNPKLTQNPGW